MGFGGVLEGSGHKKSGPKAHLSVSSLAYEGLVGHAKVWRPTVSAPWGAIPFLAVGQGRALKPAILLSISQIIVEDKIPALISIANRDFITAFDWLPPPDSRSLWAVNHFHISCCGAFGVKSKIRGG
jgi:hypothetical protein